MKKTRFSKATALEQLDKLADRIRREQAFDRHNGTSQLGRILDKDGEAMLARAVEYGRMRAFERFAEMICEGFSHED